jgi:O-methyltransferase
MGRPAAIRQALVRQHAGRWAAFERAVDFVNRLGVPGDVLEFGVFAGASLALLALSQHRHPYGLSRRVVGFDSFHGLPATRDPHPVWREGAFAVNEWWHPTLPIGAPATPDGVHDLFRACDLPEPTIVAGAFAETLPRVVPRDVIAAAIVHVDCDLYESTRDALAGVADVLQDGTMLLFDDWFLYHGNPGRGEARAFREFLAARAGWAAAHYTPYGVCGNAFILYRA